MKNDFDRIAPIYDQLAKLVFGVQLDVAQQAFLNEINPKDRVLIVGGGRGKILEWLPRDFGLQIDYVELSKKMLQQANARSSAGNDVTFKHQDIHGVQGHYDIIITNFFLDCFSDFTLENVLLHLKNQLNHNGKFLVTDFYPKESAQNRFLLSAMHRFFRMTVGLEAQGLTDIHEKVKGANLSPIKMEFFNSGTVFSAVYQRTT